MIPTLTLNFFKIHCKVTFIFQHNFLLARYTQRNRCFFSDDLLIHCKNFFPIEQFLHTYKENAVIKGGSIDVHSTLENTTDERAICSSIDMFSWYIVMMLKNSFLLHVRSFFHQVIVKFIQ